MYCIRCVDCHGCQSRGTCAWTAHSYAMDVVVLMERHYLGYTVFLEKHFIIGWMSFLIVHQT